MTFFHEGHWKDDHWRKTTVTQITVLRLWDEAHCHVLLKILFFLFFRGKNLLFFGHLFLGFLWSPKKISQFIWGWCHLGGNCPHQIEAMSFVGWDSWLSLKTGSILDPFRSAVSDLLKHLKDSLPWVVRVLGVRLPRLASDKVESMDPIHHMAAGQITLTIVKWNSFQKNHLDHVDEVNVFKGQDVIFSLSHSGSYFCSNSSKGSSTKTASFLEACLSGL